LFPWLQCFNNIWIWGVHVNCQMLSLLQLFQCLARLAVDTMFSTRVEEHWNCSHYYHIHSASYMMTLFCCFMMLDQLLELCSTDWVRWKDDCKKKLGRM
jgi:hypothetical protein